MSKQQNFYEVLNSTPTSTLDELKSNYKQLILQCHPDKLQQDKKVKEATTTWSKLNHGATTTTTVDRNVTTADDNAEFVMINKAWNTLKDPAKRKHYDAELLLTKFQMHSNIFERLTLDDMSEHEEEEEEDDEKEEAAAAVEEIYKEEVEMDMGMEKKNNEDLPESVSKSVAVSYFYTYNCRCGGQYVIDESAAADNGIYKRKRRQIRHRRTNSDDNTTNSTKVQASSDGAQRTQQNYGDNVGDKDEAAAAAAAAADVEVMVECSECSLVITLSNEQQKSKTTDSTTSR